MTAQKVQAISLFSGCGGLDVGCEKAGVHVISSMDIDRDCINTLQANRTHNGSEIFIGDIKEVTTKTYSGILKKNRPDKLILIGGPPCQPFSKNGYWVTNNLRKGISDHRNLIGEFLRIADEMRPDGILIENVESLLHPTNKKVVEMTEAAIVLMGYKYKLIKANALDYGVPQKRKRVFILAARKDINDDLKHTHCAPEDSGKLGLRPYESVRKFICKFEGAEFFEREEKTDFGTYSEELRLIPPGKNYFALTERDGYPNPKFKANTRFWNFLLKLHPDLPSWTIVSQPGPWIGPFHWSSRRLRVPEIAAIQTFPENYLFTGSRKSIQVQIGNAVPPLMAKAMIGILRESI